MSVCNRNPKSSPAELIGSPIFSGSRAIPESLSSALKTSNPPKPIRASEAKYKVPSDAMYGNDIYVDDRTIDSHIKRIRRKFKSIDKDFDSIETLYGVGYRFNQ